MKCPKCDSDELKIILHNVYKGKPYYTLSCWAKDCEFKDTHPFNYAEEDPYDVLEIIFRSRMTKRFPYSVVKNFKIKSWSPDKYEKEECWIGFWVGGNELSFDGKRIAKIIRKNQKETIVLYERRIKKPKPKKRGKF